MSALGDIPTDACEAIRPRMIVVINHSPGGERPHWVVGPSEAELGVVFGALFNCDGDLLLDAFAVVGMDELGKLLDGFGGPVGKNSKEDSGLFICSEDVAGDLPVPKGDTGGMQGEAQILLGLREG